MTFTTTEELLSDGFASWASAHSTASCVAHAAKDLCNGYTTVETFCLAQHPIDGNEIHSWTYIYVDELPEIMKATPEWVFGVCEAVKRLTDRDTDLVAFYFKDHPNYRQRIGIDMIPDECGKVWRTLTWLNLEIGGTCSVLPSGEGGEDPVMAIICVLAEFLDKGEVQCNYSGKGDSTDPTDVAAAIAYKLNLNKRGYCEFRMTLCELSNRYLIELSSRRYAA